jgi:hypothetical protein
MPILRRGLPVASLIVLAVGRLMARGTWAKHPPGGGSCFVEPDFIEPNFIESNFIETNFV